MGHAAHGTQVGSASQDFGPAPHGAGPKVSCSQALRHRSALEAGEGGTTGVDGLIVELLLDAQQLVVLGDALATGRGSRLDLAGAQGDGEIGYRQVIGLDGSVRHHA